MTKKKVADKQDSVKEVKLLLKGDKQKDLALMRSLAPNSSLIVEETKLGELLTLEKFKEEYLGEVFTIDKIKTLAINYKLRFLNSKLFVGKMDIQVIAKINEFAKMTNTDLNGHDLETKFFILAPVEMFKCNKEQKIKKRDLDSIIFYKIDDNHYRMIHKWGNDFSIFRRIIGWKWEHPKNVRHFNFLIYFPTVFITMLMSIPKTSFMNNTLFCFITSAIFSYIVAIFRNSQYTDDPFDYYPNYFTPHNWNNNRIY